MNPANQLSKSLGSCRWIFSFSSFTILLIFRFQSCFKDKFLKDSYVDPNKKHINEKEKKNDIENHVDLTLSQRPKLVWFVCLFIYFFYVLICIFSLDLCNLWERFPWNMTENGLIWWAMKKKKKSKEHSPLTCYVGWLDSFFL